MVNKNGKQYHLSNSIAYNTNISTVQFKTKDKMELKTAIEILEYHQEWRLGKRNDMIHEPKKLTQALDIVLNEVKKLEASVSGSLHPDIEKLLRYAVKQWSSLNEQSEPDHEDLVQYWLDGDCKEWIQSNYR